VPPIDEDRPRSLELDRPEGWPQSVAAVGEVDGVPVIATGSVEGAVWVWDKRTLGGERPRAIAGPFVELPSYVLEQGWDLLYAKPNLEQATSVALGNVTGYGAIVAVACGGEARMYAVADGKRIENAADRASAVECVALGSLNTRTVLVTGSTGGNVAVWDPATGTRIAGLYVDDPITNLAVDSGRILLRTATHGDYALELKEQ
jgi:WD40 repeat protein